MLYRKFYRYCFVMLCTQQYCKLLYISLVVVVMEAMMVEPAECELIRLCCSVVW